MLGQQVQDSHRCRDIKITFFYFYMRNLSRINFYRLDWS